MTKYIDAEHLKWNTGGINCGSLTVDYLKWIIDNEEPSIDVVHCKDCKHCIEYCRIVNDVMTTLACNLFYENDYCRLRVHENDFCSFAEKRAD